MRKFSIIVLILLSFVSYAEEPTANEYESELNISRVMFTPGETIDSVGLTFTMDQLHDDLRVIVNHRLYLLDSQSIDVMNDGRQLYAYKTTINHLEADVLNAYVIRKGQSVYRGRFESLGDRDTRLLFFGDLQGYKQSQYDRFYDIYRRISKEAYDLTFFAGDIVDNGDDWHQWTFFDNVIREMNEGLFVSAIGNHDTSGSSAIYEQTFNYPDNGLKEERTFYFDLPYARVAAWDTESFSTYEDQGKWLQEIMDTDKFKIVLMHRSVYPMLYDEGFVREIHKYFDEADIDLVLSGHDHIYNRTVMKDGHRADEGTTYIVGGSGSGSKFYDRSGSRNWTLAVYDEDYPVYVLVHIEEDQIHVKSYSTKTDTVLIDEHTIFK